jgi:hypothetical protein
MRRFALGLGRQPCDKLNASTRRWPDSPGLATATVSARHAHDVRFRNNAAMLIGHTGVRHRLDASPAACLRSAA